MPHFVPPRLAGEADIVGIGGPLTPEALLDAYRQGIFPWPMAGYPLLWFCPTRRAVLDLDCLHISRRLARIRRRCGLRFTFDQAFDAVISACRQAPRPGQNGTWITPEMQRAYQGLHRLGHAHSAEAWDETGTLVGGLYGVCTNGYFSGESMFHHVPNASKLALLFLLDHLAAHGICWLDCQTMTPHTEALGAREISRDEFLDRIAGIRSNSAEFSSDFHFGMVCAGKVDNDD